MLELDKDTLDYNIKNTKPKMLRIHASMPRSLPQSISGAYPALLIAESASSPEYKVTSAQLPVPTKHQDIYIYKRPIKWRHVTLFAALFSMVSFNFGNFQLPHHPEAPANHQPVPGSSQRFLDKSRSLTADCVTYDLEDSVTPHMKATARSLVRKAIDQTVPSGIRERAVRINSVDSGLALGDLTEVVSLKCLGWSIGNC